MINEKLINYYNSRQHHDHLKGMLRRRNPVEELPTASKVVMVEVDGVSEPVQATFHNHAWYMWTCYEREYDRIEDERVLCWWYMPGSLPEEVCQ